VLLRVWYEVVIREDLGFDVDEAETLMLAVARGELDVSKNHGPSTGQELGVVLPRSDARRYSPHKSGAVGVLFTALDRQRRKRLMKRLHVSPIDPVFLEEIRRCGEDGHGNYLLPFSATGAGEPLRCCLRYARRDESITLISYAPFAQPSVWREIGPVFIHAGQCEGYHANHKLPDELRIGPRLLRTYGPDGRMEYAHNTLITEDVDLAPTITQLLNEADVATIHVRTVRPQCFLYAITAAP
jgi:hypothetical protein